MRPHIASAVEGLRAQAKELTAEDGVEEARFSLAAASCIEVLEQEGVHGENEDGAKVGADWVVEELGIADADACRSVIERWRILLAIGECLWRKYSQRGSS